jgi:hypothetical protein
MDGHTDDMPPAAIVSAISVRKVPPGAYFHRIRMGRGVNEPAEFPGFTFSPIVTDGR